MDKKIKDMSNSELAQLQQELIKEYELVRKDLIKMYEYWSNIEKRYNEINTELNDRFGVNNK
jgi:predicted methyltransferase